MGYGSAGTPPWIDERRTGEDERKRKEAETASKIEALEKENELLKKRVTALEAQLGQIRK